MSEGAERVWEALAAVRREHVERLEAWGNVIYWCYEADRLTQQIRLLGVKQEEVQDALLVAAREAVLWGRVAVERSLR